MSQQSYITPIERKGFRHWLVGMGHWMLRKVNRVMRFPTGNQSIHDPSAFPWAQAMEADWEGIRDEVQYMLSIRHELPDPLPPSYDEVSAKGGDWRICPLYWLERPIEATCARCPKTAALLRQIPGLRTASFSLLGPHQHIARHEHYFLSYYIFHLGIIIPKPPGMCRMQIEDSTFTWDEGKVVLFDPTFPHEVWNDSEEVRVILAGELPRPHPFPLKVIDACFWGILKRLPWDRTAYKALNDRMEEALKAS